MPMERGLLLSLPTELRLQIYDHCLFDLDSITIGSERSRPARALTTDSGYGSQDASEQQSATMIPGLPSDHKPAIYPYYHRQLLSAGFTKAEERDKKEVSDYPFAAPFALLQTCHYIRHELTSHMDSKAGPALYLTYPYGVLVFQVLCPHLLRLARSIHISGLFHPITRRFDDDDGRRLAFPRHPRVEDSVLLPATAALGTLVRTVFARTPHATVQKLDLRIYYPNEAGNRHVWSHDASPVVIAIFNTCGGYMECALWRGNGGTGVTLTIKHQPASRYFVQVWKRLEESGERGFVVDDEWGGVGG